MLLYRRLHSSSVCRTPTITPLLDHPALPPPAYTSSAPDYIAPPPHLCGVQPHLTFPHSNFSTVFVAPVPAPGPPLNPPSLYPSQLTHARLCSLLTTRSGSPAAAVTFCACEPQWRLAVAWRRGGQAGLRPPRGTRSSTCCGRAHTGCLAHIPHATAAAGPPPAPPSPAATQPLPRLHCWTDSHRPREVDQWIMSIKMARYELHVYFTMVSKDIIMHTSQPSSLYYCMNYQ